MKCKIKYQETPCTKRWCKGECCGIWADCNNYDKYMERTLKGYDGEIKSYDIWKDSGNEMYVNIKINNRRGIHLVEDWWGREKDEACPIGYDIIDYLEIDGNVIIGEHQNDD